MRTVVCTLALLALVCPAFGQSQSASLTGIVTDSSNAAVPRAALRLVNAETGEVYRAASNDGGNYDFPLLRPGHYNLEWFNTAAFAAPALYTFGNAGRTDGYGPGLMSMDISTLNHVNFANPNVSQGNAAFGQINSLVGGNQSRIVQLGLHYKF